MFALFAFILELFFGPKFMSPTLNTSDYVCAPADSVHEHLYSVHEALLFIVADGAATI